MVLVSATSGLNVPAGFTILTIAQVPGARELAALPNGDLIAVGSTGSQVVLARLDPSGIADSTFGSNGLVIVPGLIAAPGDRSEGLAIESDDTLLIANQTADGHFGVEHLGAAGLPQTDFGTNGLASADSMNPNENAPAITARSQPNSTISGGNSREKAVRAVTAMAIVTKATAMTTQP